MKGLWRTMMPGASDANGAAAVLADENAFVVSLDSNGAVSTLRQCFDITRARAYYETLDVPELVYTLGDEDAMLSRIEELYARESLRRARRGDGAFDYLVVLNAPVSALVGLDAAHIAAGLQERLGVPTLGIEVSGGKTYDKGVARAYEALYGARPDMWEAPQGGETVRTALLLGTSALDGAQRELYGQLASALAHEGLRLAAGPGLWGAWRLAGRRCEPVAVERVIVTNAACLALAQRVQRERGVAFARLDELACFDAWTTGLRVSEGARVLVVGEQLHANVVRRLLERMGAGRVDVATFFTSAKALRGQGDCKLSCDTELAELVRQRRYDAVIADELFAPLVSPTPLVAYAHPIVWLDQRRGDFGLSRGWLAQCAQQLARAQGNASDGHVRG